jgi:hypothetical protein
VVVSIKVPAGSILARLASEQVMLCMHIRLQDSLDLHAEDQDVVPPRSLHSFRQTPAMFVCNPFQFVDAPEPIPRPSWSCCDHSIKLERLKDQIPIELREREDSRSRLTR